MRTISESGDRPLLINDTQDRSFSRLLEPGKTVTFRKVNICERILDVWRKEAFNSQPKDLVIVSSKMTTHLACTRYLYCPSHQVENSRNLTCSLPLLPRGHRPRPHSIARTLTALE